MPLYAPFYITKKLQDLLHQSLHQDTRLRPGQMQNGPSQHQRHYLYRLTVSTGLRKNSRLVI